MSINFLAVGLAALSAFFLGFIWYNVVFSKPWQQELGNKSGKSPMPQNLGQLLITSLILEVIMAIALSTFIPTEVDAMRGFVIGLTVGVAVGLAFGVNYLFEGKTLKHWAINAVYNVIVFAVMGAIIGAL